MTILDTTAVLKLLESQNQHSLLEIVYFLSNIALAIIAAVALWQLKIAKDDIRLRSKRESATLAASQCQRFTDKIIPIANDLDIEFGKLSLSSYSSELKLKYQQLSEEDLTLMRKIVKESIPALNKIISMITSLESFSIFFINEIADEQIAFTSTGHNFCNYVKKYSPFIALLRKDEPLHNFQNTVELYNIWSSRLARQQITDEIDILKSQLEKKSDKSIKPLGT